MGRVLSLVFLTWVWGLSWEAGASPQCIPALVSEPSDSKILGSLFSHRTGPDPAAQEYSGHQPFSVPGGVLLQFERVDSIGSFPHARAPVPVQHGGYGAPGDYGVYPPGPVTGILRDIAAALRGRLQAPSFPPLPELQHQLRTGGTVASVARSLQHALDGKLYLHWDARSGVLHAYPGSRIRVLLPPQDSRYEPDAEVFPPGSPAVEAWTRTALDGAAATMELLRSSYAGSIEYEPPGILFASVPQSPGEFVQAMRDRADRMEFALFLDVYFFEASRLTELMSKSVGNGLLFSSGMASRGPQNVESEVFRFRDGLRDQPFRREAFANAVRKHSYMGRVAVMLLERGSSRYAGTASVRMGGGDCVHYHAVRPGNPLERSGWEQSYADGREREAMSVSERSFAGYHRDMRIDATGPGEVGPHHTGLRMDLIMDGGGAVSLEAAFGDLVRVDYDGSPGTGTGTGVPDVVDPATGRPGAGLQSPRLSLLIRPRVRYVAPPVARPSASSASSVPGMGARGYRDSMGGFGADSVIPQVPQGPASGEMSGP